MFIKTSIKTQLLALIPGQIRLLTFEILDRDYLFTHSKLNISYVRKQVLVEVFQYFL